MPPGHHSQAQRAGRLLTLGEEKLVLKRFQGTDFVNDLFEYRVEALDEDANLDFDTLLGTKASVEIKTIKNETRYFHGYITECAWIGSEDLYHTYALTLRPNFWLLSLARNNRIFHEMTPKDILTKVLQDAKVTDFKFTVTSNPKLHYTVQYGETDYAFACRLMERHGYNYYFEHTSSGHTMVITDQVDAFKKLDGTTRDYLPLNVPQRTKAERFWEISNKRQMTTGKIRLMDYDPLKPNANMKVEKSAGLKHAFGDREVYRYPGEYMDPSVGKTYGDIRMEQARTRDKHHFAKGDVMTLSAGLRVKIEGDHPTGSTGKEYLCLRSTHSFTNNDYRSAGGSGGSRYSGDFELLPSAEPCRPDRKTPLARIDGPQTGKVVGKQGEDIDVDAHGRILVHFHWDTENKYSMRCRVAQLWAHNKWGAVFTPRIGMEVVVVFVDGDPDKPLVVGCVYNGNNKPPWDLPGKKNINGIKSRSTTKGGADNFNELSFDDTKGKELFNQQAERDMKTLVKRNERRDVWVDRTTTIGQDEKRLVKRNEEHEIEENSDWIVGKDQSYEIGDNSDWTIGKDESRDVGKNRKTDIGINDTLKVGSTLKIEAGTKIELKCGSSKITMTPASIKIESVAVTVKASAMLKTQGSIVEHKSSGPMTIKGAIIMIN